MIKNKGVTRWTLASLIEHSQTVSKQIDEITWVPARPLGYSSLVYRIKCAWLVFTGRADLVIWPGNQ